MTETLRDAIMDFAVREYEGDFEIPDGQDVIQIAETNPEDHEEISISVQVDSQKYCLDTLVQGMRVERCQYGTEEELATEIRRCDFDSLVSLNADVTIRYEPKKQNIVRKELFCLKNYRAICAGYNVSGRTKDILAVIPLGEPVRYEYVEELGSIDITAQVTV